MIKLPTLFFILLFVSCSQNDQSTSNQKSQNPSPMVESARKHERIEKKEYPGIYIRSDTILSKSVEIYIPEQYKNSSHLNLLIHFHGSAYIPVAALQNVPKKYILTVVNLGSGSSVYQREFSEHITFTKFLSIVKQLIKLKLNSGIIIDQVLITSFSAGYGAVRAILQGEGTPENIDGIILLDGLHTDYIPDKTVVADGGRLNAEKLEPFLTFANLAKAGQTFFLITHSEIFPGTYASTTETADYLIQSTGLKRVPVLKWGPGGMQQLSEVCQNRFYIFGFAGNSAPDHIDHFHGFNYFLELF